MGVSWVISYSLYEFRNVQRQRIFKQNLIFSISSRLIEFWCFGLPAALGVGGWVYGGGGGWGVPHTHVHMHAHTCMHAHTRMVNMIISCKWPPPLGESLGIPYDVICACTCMRVHVHVCGGTLSPPRTHIHPPPTPQGGHPRNQSKFNST